MGILDAPAVDWRQKSLGQFSPTRDLPGCFAWFDSSTVVGNAGDTVKRLGDLSGNNYELLGATGTSPVIAAAQLNGKNVITYASGKFLAAVASPWKALAKAQPTSWVALVKARSAGNSATVRGIVGAGTSNGIALLPNNTGGFVAAPYGYAGATGVTGGAGLNDDQWHVIVVVNSTTPAVYVDGYLMAAGNTQAAGTNTANGAITLGAFFGYFDGDIAVAGGFAGELTQEHARQLTSALNRDWALGLTVPKQDGVVWRDVVDANGQNVRLFAPRNVSGTPALVIYNHHLGASSTFFAPTTATQWYAVVHSLVNAGYVVACPTNHGDYWSAPTAIADGPAAEVVAASTLGVAGFSKVILVGQSMGGMLSLAQMKYAAFTAPCKGAYLIDAATNLADMYGATGQSTTVNTGFGIVAGTLAALVAANATSFTSTASFNVGDKVLVDRVGATPETLTIASKTGSGTFTYGVSGGGGTGGGFVAGHASGVNVADYPSKTKPAGTDGYDPNLWTSAQLPQGKRYRFVASAADALAVKTKNTDIFQPLAAAPAANSLESAVVIHGGAHLTDSFQPKDVVAFADRC